MRARGEAVRQFIISNLESHPADIVRITSEEFGSTRQAVHAHLNRLIGEGVVTSTGNTRAKTYSLASLVKWGHTYDLQGVDESQVWRDDVSPTLGRLPENVTSLWQYGITEMLNNALEHSAGATATLDIEKTAAATRIILTDDGVGIFKKIQDALGLMDERHAVLELAKGKFTTDPVHHTGEGIFFSSRMFDRFAILSGDVYFSHQFGKTEDWIMQSEGHQGTAVFMSLSNHTSRTTQKVFDKFSSGDDYGFTKTVVPVKLLQYGDDNLVSRSQAKRLLARIERFRTVVLDFTGVASIGQAFADEVFRVFPSEHAEIELVPLNMNSAVKQMISRSGFGA